MRVNEGIYHMWVAAYVRNCACMWVTLRTCVIHTVGVIHTVYVGDCVCMLVTVRMCMCMGDCVCL